MARVFFKHNHPNPKKATSIDAVLYVSDKIKPHIATGERVLPKHWNGTRVTGGPNKVEINLHLNQIEKDLLQVWRDNKDKDKETLVQLARKAVKGDVHFIPTLQKKTVLEPVAQWIALSGNDPKTIQKYRALEKRLTEFSMAYPIDLRSLDFNFLDAFKTFLYGIPNPNYTKYHLEYDSAGEHYTVCAGAVPGNVIGLFDDIVFKYITNLKVFCGWAVERGFEVNPSYKKWKTIKREYPPISLTEDELDNLESRAFPEKHLDIARDFLSLECRTGQRISDLKRINKADIRDNVWHFTQKKGNRQKAKHIRLPLVGFSANALAILQKYNYVLPKMSEQKLNEHIKTVCQKVGIDQPIYIERYAGSKKVRIPGFKYEFLSSHSGKKTFITLLAQKGASIKSISDLTGTSIKTIERHYLGEMDTKSLAEVLEKAGGQKATMRIAN